MKTKLVIGNWKMNGDLARNEALIGRLREGLPDGAGYAVCVPAPYLAQVGALVRGSAIALGAQNASEHVSGAYTGEIAVSMLCDFHCRYVIVGHSERRTLFGEMDALVAAKARVAIEAGLVPVVCVGETLVERERGEEEGVLARQLAAVADVLGKDLVRCVVAYEPVWAIGTGRAATPDQVQAMMGFIRGWLGARIPGAADVPLLYGGSVKADTAQGLFALPDVDGALVGGASLVADEFIKISEAAAAVSKHVV